MVQPPRSHDGVGLCGDFRCFYVTRTPIISSNTAASKKIHVFKKAGFRLAACFRWCPIWGEQQSMLFLRKWWFNNRKWCVKCIVFPFKFHIQFPIILIVLLWKTSVSTFCFYRCCNSTDYGLNLLSAASVVTCQVLKDFLLAVGSTATG